MPEDPVRNQLFMKPAKTIWLTIVRGESDEDKMFFGNWHNSRKLLDHYSRGRNRVEDPWLLRMPGIKGGSKQVKDSSAWWIVFPTDTTPSHFVNDVRVCYMFKTRSSARKFSIQRSTKFGEKTFIRKYHFKQL